MGETMSTQRKHLVCGEQHIEGWKQYQVDYDESLNNGHIESWISHLKTEFAAMSPETSVYKCFSSPAALAKYTTVDNAVAAFFDNIMMMFRADLGARGVLDEAWECFSCFCQNNCEHCYAQSEQGGPTLIPIPESRGTSTHGEMSPPDDEQLDLADGYKAISGTIEDRSDLHHVNLGPPPSGGSEHPSTVMPVLEDSTGILNHPEASGHAEAVASTSGPDRVLQIATDTGTNEAVAAPDTVQPTLPLADTQLRKDHGVTPVAGPEVIDQGTDVDARSSVRTSDSHRASVSARPAMIPNPHSPIWYIRTTGNNGTYVLGQPGRLEGLYLLRYDLQGKSVRLMKKSRVQNRDAIVFYLPRTKNPTIRLPDRVREIESGTGFTITPWKNLRVRYNMLRAVGVIKQMVVYGPFSDAELAMYRQ